MLVKFTHNTGRRSAPPVFRWLRVLFVLAVFVLPACTPTPINISVITGIEFSGRSQRPNGACDGLDAWERRNCTPELQESLRFAQRGTQISILPTGRGTCTSVQVDFGDGTAPVTLQNQVLDNGSFQVFHTYSGWPGVKLVRVIGLDGCLGDVTREITVGIGPEGRTEFHLGYAPSTTVVCNVLPSMPPLRTGTGIALTTNGMKLRFGPFLEYAASGDLSMATPADYPFPGMRPYSVVYRVGTQIVQGETGRVVFRAAETAPLEICVNDSASFLGDNSGAMEIVIEVNEMSAGN